MDDIEFGKKLRELRINAGKTVPEVSEYLKSIGCKAATQTIYGWERGHSQPTTDTFMAMCVFYGLKEVLPIFGYDSPSNKENIDGLSKAEQFHIKKYRSLDSYGKEAVDAILDVEHKRCTQKAKAESVDRTVEKLVYINPAAAGSPLYAESDFERLTFPESDVPTGADFGIRISGRSMEPTVPDGCIAWVHKTVDLDDGTVGIFMLNDSATCKRYFKNADGTFCLESDNPEFGPVPVTEYDTILPVGKVIGIV